MSTYAAALTASARARRLDALEFELSRLGDSGADQQRRIKLGVEIREAVEALQYGKDDR